MRDDALHCLHFASAPCTSVSLSSPKLVSRSATTKFDGDGFTGFVNWKAGGPCEPPAVKIIPLLARAFARRLRLLHLFRHLRFHCVKIETRAPLHWRVIEEGLEFLAHHLLDEHKAPELELEPIEVLLRAFLRSIVWPTLALERIETQVDQIRHVNVRLFTQPTLGLVDETILVVVNTHRADGAFAEVEDLVTVRWAFAGDSVHLVVTVQVGLVSPVAEFHALKQLVSD